MLATNCKIIHFFKQNINFKNWNYLCIIIKLTCQNYILASCTSSRPRCRLTFPDYSSFLLASPNLIINLCLTSLDANCWVSYNLDCVELLKLSCRLSLLVVYYAEVLGRSTSTVPFRLCVFGNSIFLCVCIVLSVSSEANAMEDYAQRVLKDLFVAVASFFSFLIAALLGYFGQKFSEFHKSDKVNRSLLPHSVEKFHLMNLMLVSIFILRGILIILSAANYGNFPSDTKVVKTDSNSQVSALEMAYFLIIEILPCSFVLVTLWQTLCPKNSTKSIDDDEFCNHSELNAKYNDMFSPRGSQISRDGDDVVRVVYSNILLDNQNGSGNESPSLSVSLSPLSPLQRNRMVLESHEVVSDIASPIPHYPPRMPLPIGRRPVVIPPNILHQSSDDSEERPSNDLQYYHPNLSLDQIQSSPSNPSSDHTTFLSPNDASRFSVPRPHLSINSSLTSGNSVPSTVPSFNNWLMESDAPGTPHLQRPPSAPATTATTTSTNSFYNSLQFPRPNNILTSSSVHSNNSLASSEEKAQLMKQFANTLSPKYILHRYL